jgi:hypothetical protein
MCALNDVAHDSSTFQSQLIPTLWGIRQVGEDGISVESFKAEEVLVEASTVSFRMHVRKLPIIPWSGNLYIYAWTKPD